MDKWSEEGRKAINRAPIEAKEIGHSYTGSEHLLLALLNSETSLACRVLKELGINKKKAREKIIEICKRMERKHEKPNGYLFNVGRESDVIINLTKGKPFTINII